jgi:serine/threonine protein kinase
MKQIAEGLVYLHDEKKTLHRDLKPENILMMGGVPKIADLGIAKIMKTGGLSTKNCTPFYASQEFLNEERYEFPADVWSLGIIFLEMLSGKRINQ